MTQPPLTLMLLLNVSVKAPDVETVFESVTVVVVEPTTTMLTVVLAGTPVPVTVWPTAMSALTEVIVNTLGGPITIVPAAVKTPT